MEITKEQQFKKQESILETKLASNFFDHQSEVEKEIGGGGDFKKVSPGQV